MSSKILYIYNSYQIFEILNEIKEELNFEIRHIDEKDYKKLSLNEIGSNLIVTTGKNVNIKNCIIIDNLPEKLSKVIEKINLGFLRNQFSSQSELKIGKYKLDLNSRKINFKDISLDLTERESDLILFLNLNKKVSLKEIQKQVWGYSIDLETHTVETHIYRLRKKMLQIFKDDDFIKHDKIGYYLN